MFKKRTQNPESVRRRTQDGVRSNKVFSYHANRNPYDGARSRDAQRDEVKAAVSERVRRVRSTGKVLISILIALVLLAAAAYNATLQQEVSVSIAGKPEERLLLQNAKVYQDAVQRILAQKPAYRTKLTIDTDGINKQLLQDYPELSAADVSLPLIGRTPSLQLQPAPVAARLVASNGQSYVLSSDGRAISTNVDAAPVSSPMLTDQSGVVVSVGAQVLPRDDMRFITRLQYQLASQDLKIESMLLPAAGRQLHIKLDGKSYVVKFSFAGDVLQQVGAYRSVQKKLDRDGITPAEYIDVRVGDRSYYK